MPKPDTTIALAVVSSHDLICKDEALTRLQAATVEQFQVIGRMRGEEALRSLLAGLMLHRIKASLPYGDFGKWTKKHLQQFGDRWVNYLMRLALIFVQASKITKPLMLAMPGDQTELQLESMQGQQRAFYDRAMKFVGRHSISELLDKHDIKTAKKLGGARSKRADAKKDADENADPKVMAQAAREQISAWFEDGRQLLFEEGLPNHLSASERTTLTTQLTSFAAEVRKTLGSKKRQPSTAKETK